MVDVGRLLPALFPGLLNRVRGDEDRPALLMTNWLRWAAIGQAVERGLSGYVTTADPAMIDRLLAAVGGNRQTDLVILDPGRKTVIERLRKSQPGRDRVCERVVDKWYSRL